MPAAMVIPMAAAIPNDMPRTLSRRPRPTVRVELAMEEASVMPDNVGSRGILETEPSHRGEGKKQAGSGYSNASRCERVNEEWRRNYICSTRNARAGWHSESAHF